MNQMCKTEMKKSSDAYKREEKLQYIYAPGTLELMLCKAATNKLPL